MTDIRTVSLSGAELAVTDISGANICIKNSGSETLYASAHSGVTADAPGVLPVDPGTSAILPDCKGSVYLLGRGKAVLAGGDTKFNLFSPAPGHGSGDSGGSTGSVDCELIRCEERGAYDEGRVVDVSGAKYFGIIAKGPTGVYVAVLSGNAYSDEQLIYISSGSSLNSYISPVPPSGKIYVTGGLVRYALYTSDSHEAIFKAVTARMCGRVFVDEETDENS